MYGRLRGRIDEAIGGGILKDVLAVWPANGDFG